MSAPFPFFDSTMSFWRRKWQPTPVFLPGESHGQRSLVGYSPWGRKESDTTERLTQTQASFWASLVAQLVKNPPAIRETLVRFLGREDPLEKGVGYPPSIPGLCRWLRQEGYSPWGHKEPDTNERLVQHICHYGGRVLWLFFKILTLPYVIKSCLSVLVLEAVCAITWLNHDS